MGEGKTKQRLGRPAKVTVAMTPVVSVVVRGEPNPKGFPALPIDDGQIGALLAWIREQGIHTRVRGGTVGPGFMTGFFEEKDARRIVDKANELGCTYVEDADQP